MNLYKKSKDKNDKFYYLVISKDGKKKGYQKKNIINKLEE